MDRLKLELKNQELCLIEESSSTEVARTAPIGSSFKEFRRIGTNCIIVKEDEQNFPIDNEGNKANIYCLNDNLDVVWCVNMPFENDGFPNPIQWDVEIKEVKTPEGYLTIEYVENPNAFTCSSWAGFTISVDYKTGETIHAEFTK